MKLQRGLTLVELIVVVTIFVMMAAVAVPRFAFLSAEARVEAVKSLTDEVRSSADLTHRVWESAGRPDRLNRNGVTLELHNGYPSAAAVGTIVVDDAGFDFDTGVWHYAQNGKRIDGCSVSYSEPLTASDRPQITTKTEGC